MGRGRRQRAAAARRGSDPMGGACMVPANLAEGHGRFGRDRQHHWRIASGSAKEAECHLRLLASAGAVDGSGLTKALESFDQVRAMTWRLLNPR